MHILTLHQTGAGTSMSKLGWADLGMATLDTMRANAEMVSSRQIGSSIESLLRVYSLKPLPLLDQIASLDPTVPVIADADTGYGGPIMVSRTVTQYARAGVAALHIEDQVFFHRYETPFSS